jgi:hypothetical protein
VTVVGAPPILDLLTATCGNVVPPARVGGVQPMAGSSVVEGRLVDRMCTQPTPEPRLPVALLSAGRGALDR